MTKPMRILQVHKYLYRKAGAEAYVLDLAELLAAHGHEVALWGTDQISPTPPNLPSGPGRGSLRDRGGKIVSPPRGGGVRGGQDERFVHHLNFDKREGLWRDLKKFGHMIWSFEAARKFEEVLISFKPDVIHAHNIYHHISPSILSVAARHGVPVVMTVHDYHLINPNYTLYDHGAVCERTGFAAITHRCIKNSYAATCADVIETSIHRLMGVYKKNVAHYVTPTRFVKNMLVEHGMQANQIGVLPLPVLHNPPHPSLTLREGESANVPPLKVRGGRGSYVLFAGRLAKEKGIYLVLEIAKRLPDIRFKIAGDGPEGSGLRDQVLGRRLRNVEVLGFVEQSKLKQLIAVARLVIVPSLWYDPSPYAVLEAMAAGKVVLGSRMGGIPELIEDGKTGFLIPSPGLRPPSPRSTAGRGEGQWIDTIKKVYYNEALLKRVGVAARAYAKRIHNPEKHYERLMEIYKEITEKSQNTNYK